MGIVLTRWKKDADTAPVRAKAPLGSLSTHVSVAHQGGYGNSYLPATASSMNSATILASNKCSTTRYVSHCQLVCASTFLKHTLEYFSCCNNKVCYPSLRAIATIYEVNGFILCWIIPCVITDLGVLRYISIYVGAR